MLIVITDVGNFWNHHNPVLEKYKRNVIVVCLNGEKLTDKYRCVVNPYKQESILDTIETDIHSSKFQALKVVKEQFQQICAYHNDIVFLTDNEPESLYPYLILNDSVKNKRLHLWCFSPWKFNGLRRRKAYYDLMYDLDHLTSLHYVDADEYLELGNQKTNISEMRIQCRDWLNSMLPTALYEIEREMEGSERYYYDLRKKRYINIEKLYLEILNLKPIEVKPASYIPTDGGGTMGFFIPKIPYPNSDKNIKEVVQQLHPRLDGKKICERLKEMRICLAEANGIKLETVECPSIGPCAGTCERCDMEIKYLQEELLKIKEEDKKYPQIDI